MLGFKSFETADQCEDFIDQNKNYRLILIVSGQIGRDLVPRIHTLPQVISIYVIGMAILMSLMVLAMQ